MHGKVAVPSPARRILVCMSKFNSERWHRLLNVFDLIQEAPPLDRELLALHVCPEDREVRARALMMAKALDDDPDFMKVGPVHGIDLT